MPLPYSQNKQHVYAWRKANPEKMKEIYKNQNSKTLGKKRYMKEVKRLSNILI